MTRFFDRLTLQPKLSLLLVLLGTLPVAAGAFWLRIDFSPDQVYVGYGNAVEFCEQHKQLFRFEDSLVLVLLEATDDRSLLRQDALQWMQQFADRAAKFQGVRDVTSIVTLERPRVALRGEDRVTWTPLLDPELYGDTDYLQSRLRHLPLLNDTLISQNQNLLMTLIDLDPENRVISSATARVSQIEDLLQDLPAPAHTQTLISGVPAIRVDVIRSIISDQKRMVPLCSSLFLLVSLLIFRSPLVTCLSLFAVLTSVALTLGLMGWLSVTFSIMSNMIPTLVLIIGAANSVHILSRFQVEMRTTAADARTCACVTMREMSHTCFLTLATTAVGFGSLLIAEADLLKSLAIQAAAGMACCYVSLMLVMGPTLVLCARQLSPGRSLKIDRALAGLSPGVSRLDKLWSAFGAWIPRYSGRLIILHLLLAVVTLWMCRDMRINSFMFETYDGDHPTMEVVQKMDEHMSGLISLEVQLRAPDRQRFFDGDLAAALASVRQQVREDRRITFYRDYVEFLSEFDHGRTLTDDAQAAAASLRRVKLVLRQLQTPEVTAPFLASGQPVARVMMRIKDVGSAGMKDLFAEVETILHDTLPPDIQFTLTGDAWLHAVCMDVFVRDLFYSLIAASGIIFLLITVLFRSIRTGLIASVPNLLPLVATLGYMYLRDYELTAGNVIVFAISLGIAVDDTIHFLARYRDERRLAEPAQAIQATLLTSGRAILMTSVLVVSGLSVLIFSDFVPTRRFAELTAITMCAALPGDILLLPALLLQFGGGIRRVSPKQPENT